METSTFSALFLRGYTRNLNHASWWLSRNHYSSFVTPHSLQLPPLWIIVHQHFYPNSGNIQLHMFIFYQYLSFITIMNLLESDIYSPSFCPKKMDDVHLKFLNTSGAFSGWSLVKPGPLAGMALWIRSQLGAPKLLELGDLARGPVCPVMGSVQALLVDDVFFWESNTNNTGEFGFYETFWHLYLFFFVGGIGILVYW